MTRVADAPRTITAATFGPHGERFLLSDYSTGWLYHGLHQAPTRIPLPHATQGESLEFSDNWHFAYRRSEGSPSTINTFQVLG